MDNINFAVVTTTKRAVIISFEVPASMNFSELELLHEATRILQREVIRRESPDRKRPTRDS
jgi:hypothetical protein